MGDILCTGIHCQLYMGIWHMININGSVGITTKHISTSIPYRYQSQLDLSTTNDVYGHIMPPLIMFLLPGSKVCWIPRCCKAGRVRAEGATEDCKGKPAGCSGQWRGHIPKNHSMPMHVIFYFFITCCNIEKQSVNIDLLPSIALQPLVKVSEIPALVAVAETALRNYKVCKDAGQLGWKPWCFKTW